MNNADKFPAILRKKIEEGQFVFPQGTEYKYDSFHAYRVYFRNENEKNRSIDREDFRSWAEEGKRYPRGKNKDLFQKYYGTSLFCNEDELCNVKSFPKPIKKIARGIVDCSGGPCLKSDKDSHITWWLYEIVDLSSFVEV